MSEHGSAFCVSALLLLAATVLASREAAAATKVRSIEGITEYRLDNGLQVLLYPDNSQPTVTVNLTVFVGSRHEGYGETGMAHLLEHMVFKGTPDHPEVPKVLQERGARFNGTTSVDRTNYYETLPATTDNLQFALRLEADRLVNSFIRREDLFSEMTVVRNEFERAENSPASILQRRIMAAAFDWHNYGKATIGNRSDIELVPIERLQDFYQKHYQPDNCMLVVAGRFDEAKALAAIDATFGVIPRPDRVLDNTYTLEPPQDGERTVTLRRVGEVGAVGAAYHVPASGHPDSAAMQVLANVAANAPSGRLYKALVETGLAVSVSSFSANWHDPGVFSVYAEVRKDGSLDAVREKLLEITESLATADISDEEVERARQQILKQRELAAADTSAIAVQLSNWAGQGDWRLYFLHRDRIEQVTAAEVKEAAARYLTRNNRTVGTFIPADAAEKTPVPTAPDLEELLADYTGREGVSEGEAFDVAPTAIEARTTRGTLPGGLKLAMLPKKTRGQTVQLRLVLRYGTPESLRGYETAGDFLPPLLLRGTKQLTRQQIQDSLDRQRARLSASGGLGVVAFDLQTKRDNLPAVLEVLRQVLREPTLPAEEFEILKQQHLAGLEEQRTDPQNLAMLAVRRTLAPFPREDVRYVPTADEEIARSSAASAEQVRKLYDEFLSGQYGEVSVVGDFDPAEVESQLSQMFDGWNTSQPYERIPRKAFSDIAGGREEIVVPDKANAVYTAGFVFPLRDDHADYPALVLGNFVLGGGSLSSRLGDRVRQREGLSYGVGSGLAAEALDERASITLRAICNPDNIDKVDAAIREELARLLADGVTPEELDRAKAGYLQAQQVARTHDGSLTALLSDTLFTGRTLDYYADQEARIAALKPEDITAALRTHIDPSRLVIVTAGSFAP